MAKRVQRKTKPPAARSPAIEPSGAKAAAPAESGPKTIEHENGSIVDVGTRVRVERAFRPEADPHDARRWLVDAGGEAVYKWLVFELVDVVGGRHPITNVQTTVNEVWVKRGDHSSKDDAVADARNLAMVH